MIEADLLTLLQRLGVALAIGFLIGVERGWKHRGAEDGARAAGLRTHAIIGLFGGVAGALTPAVGQVGFAALALAFAWTFVQFKAREADRDQDISVTGTIAGLLVFALGAFAVLDDPAAAAAAGVALAGLLAFKDTLHSWLGKLTWAELRSALLILAASAIALPLIPPGAVDPWGYVNPRELWLLTILVAGASFAGYVAVRVLGEDVGLLAGAAAGAMVSSTVTTAELGRRVRAGEAPAPAAAAGASLAAAVSMGRIGALVATTAPALLAPVWAPILAAGAAYLLGAAALRRFARSALKAKAGERLHSPLNLVSVAQFAGFLAAVIVVGRVVEAQFGEVGLLPFAAAAGLADVDAVTLAAGSLVRGGLPPIEGAHAVLVAAAVNAFSKAGIGWGAGGPRYAGLYLAVTLAAAAAGAAAWFAFGP